MNSKQFGAGSKLSEVWDAKTGRHIIALFDSPDAPDDDLFWKLQEVNTWVQGWEITSFKSGTLKILEDAKKQAYSQKFFAIRSSVTPDDNGKLISLGLFSSDYPSSARELADETNPVVFDWIRNEWMGKYPINLIWADYYNRHDLVDLAKTVNGIKVAYKKSNKVTDTKWKGWKEPSKQGLF